VAVTAADLYEILLHSRRELRSPFLRWVMTDNHFNELARTFHWAGAPDGTTVMLLGCPIRIDNTVKDIRIEKDLPHEGS